MPTYHYKALTREGRYVEGSLETGDAGEARARLRSEQLTPVHLRESGGRLDAASVKVSGVTAGSKVDISGVKFEATEGDKLSLQFLEKLHQLLQGGMPLGDAVKSLDQRLTNPKLKAIAHGFWKDLSEGSTLAGAMRRFGQVFENTVISMVEAGEATGNLKPILLNINSMLEARLRMRKEIISGLAYPVFITILAFGVVGFFLFFLLPRIQGMMEATGGEMSFMAKVVIGLSGALLYYGPFVVVGGLILWAVLYQWRKSDEGRHKTDRFFLKLPGIGPLLRNADLARMANLASTLLGSGVDTTEAMRLIEKSIRNRELRMRFHAARGLINDGGSFTVAFQRFALLADTDIDILGISENTGSLVQGFDSVYRARLDELNDHMRQLTVIVSSGALIFAFGLVIVIVLGIITSILQLSQSIMG